MLPPFNEAGLLPPGIHQATWRELAKRFGINSHRRQLLRGLRSALRALVAAGCQTAYVNGSFVTAKEMPGDFDACWEVEGVDADLLDPVLLNFADGRAAQKARYLGELFPVLRQGASGTTFLEFFQIDKETGDSKGIVMIDLRRWKR